MTLQGVILAFSAWIGFQTYKMHGCIERIEGHLGISKSGKNGSDWIYQKRADSTGYQSWSFIDGKKNQWIAWGTKGIIQRFKK